MIINKINCVDGITDRVRVNGNRQSSSEPSPLPLPAIDEDSQSQSSSEPSPLPLPAIDEDSQSQETRCFYTLNAGYRSRQTSLAIGAISPPLLAQERGRRNRHLRVGLVTCPAFPSIWGKNQNKFPSVPSFGTHENKETETTFMSMTALMEAPKQGTHFDIKTWGWSLLSFVPFVINAKNKIQVPPVVNKELKKHARPSDGVDSIGFSNVRFRPYVSKVPWHSGPRAFLSQLFPRYGHYCGPNWSSGKDGGTLLWDKRPIDWLDFCCYCHDIGYDTHDQAELLKADLAFLECLERPRMSVKGDPRVALLYNTMCISGLKNILIPYRTHLLKLQLGQFTVGFGWLSNMKWKGWNPRKTYKVD